MKIKDYSISQEVFELKYIKEYDMFQTLPVPENLEKYYESEEYISHTDSKKGIVAQLYQWVKKYNLRKKVNLINKYKPQKGKLLDIGAGTADFLLTAQKDNWQIFGVEPNKKARKNANKKGIKLQPYQEEFLKEKFDCITLWHVLEHIPNLKNEIELLKKILRKDGILIIAVPNYRSWDMKYYGRHWAAYDVPRHLWHFSKTSIETLFKEVNMEIIEIKPMWFDAFYVSILSEKYKTGKRNLLKAFVSGLRSNFYGIRKNEFSSHIYVLKNKKK